MNKRILISLSLIAVVGALAIGGTIAYFNDTETSSGNIFVAGSIDLKVDHVAQTYNGVDCKTCSVTVISDETDMVIEKNEASITPYPAVYAWVHPNWTSQNDPILDAAGAEWIWEHNPTRDPEDTKNNVSYTFKKDFEWWGPIVNTDLYMAIGSDNSVKVYLNNVLIGENTSEYGYLQGSMLHIPAANITGNINQGSNTLKFVVKNWGLPNGTYSSNPAGLIYKFSIDGMCGDDWFKSNCQLWGETDLTNQTFFNFNDVKPADYGTNLISLHVDDNDAWICLLVDTEANNDNGLVDPEITANDTTGGDNEGELNNYLNVALWDDVNEDGIHQSSEAILYSGLLANADMAIAEGGGTPVPGGTTVYVGLAWCAGAITADTNTAEIDCDGSTMLDDAQTDSLMATLTAYAEQSRNNDGFTCVNALK